MFSYLSNSFCRIWFGQHLEPNNTTGWSTSTPTPPKKPFPLFLIIKAHFHHLSTTNMETLLGGFSVDLWNSTRPPRPVSGSIQAVPSLDVNQANVGTRCLQEVAHDNTLQEAAVGRVSSLPFRHTVGASVSLLTLTTLSKIYFYPLPECIWT